MPRHPDSRNGKVQTSRNLEINGGKSDGNPDPPVEHVIEEAVARIIVVLGVATESKGFKQDLIDFLDGFYRAVGRIQLCPGDGSHMVEEIQVRTQLELRIFLACHDESRFGKRDSGLR